MSCLESMDRGTNIRKSNGSRKGGSNVESKKGRTLWRTMIPQILMGYRTSERTHLKDFENIVGLISNYKIIAVVKEQEKRQEAVEIHDVSNTGVR